MVSDERFSPIGALSHSFSQCTAPILSLSVSRRNRPSLSCHVGPRSAVPRYRLSGRPSDVAREITSRCGMEQGLFTASRCSADRGEIAGSDKCIDLWLSSLDDSGGRHAGQLGLDHWPQVCASQHGKRRGAIPERSAWVKVSGGMRLESALAVRRVQVSAPRGRDRCIDADLTDNAHSKSEILTTTPIDG